MIDNRLIPAIKSKGINTEDLIDLLRNIEEYGHQHIFLYKCPEETATALINTDRITSIMKKSELSPLIDKPKILDQPQTPEITDVRLEHTNNNSNNFIIKIIETRESSELISESVKKDILTKKWRIKKQRAVNLFKLRADGWLELRIASQKNSTKYKSEINKMWEIVEEFLPKASFTEISLSRAKENLWDKRAILQDKIRYSDTTLKNENGNTIRALTGSHLADLYEDNGINDSMEVFHNNDAYCDSHNIWFKFPSIPDNNSHEIHVLLSGEMNEFAITAQCSAQEYEYVYDQLRSFNN
jgi:hypothetical protein